jgi:hypothetical protein
MRSKGGHAGLGTGGMVRLPISLKKMLKIREISKKKNHISK